MTKYEIGTFADKEEIVDFINYVFSQAHCPHDFKKLFPHCYGDNCRSLGAVHFLAKEDGKLKALIALRIITLRIYEKKLTLGLIGNVAVHPYSRGKGYMKELMAQAIEYSKSNGVDIMVLAGQRQRYGYFGFENAGTAVRFVISSSSIKHALSHIDSSDIHFEEITEQTPELSAKAYALSQSKPFHAERNPEEFSDILRTWGHTGYAIIKNGEFAGYTTSDLCELILENEDFFPAVVKAYFDTYEKKEMIITAAPFENERICHLKNICERYTLESVEMVNVLCWKNTIETLLALKASYTNIGEGSETIKIENKEFSISYSNDMISVFEQEIPVSAENLTHTKAIEAVFGLDGYLTFSNRKTGCFPLPFYMNNADTF